ncbi:ABC transporter permease [Moorella sp. Hama-1]|uniref:ABC transporter permease n=1 Tax=Moorella sp. Hama-1 TaxID=2138101 RepID=UPI000D6448DA|nr:ABC transporter permease [Moorella sp. Hama-1]BCV20649.1 ribose ABC transporter permease [Moorella sp. Hama-1]
MPKVSQNLRQNQLFMAGLIAIALFIGGGLVNASFLSPANIGSILAMAVLLGFAAAGQTLVVIAGGEGIDLSVGAVMSLGAVLAAQTMAGQNSNIAPALVLVILAGATIGLFNAAGILYARVPPLVMTMAMANVVTTIQLIYTHGSPVGMPAPIIAFLGSRRLFPFLPWLVVLGLIMIILMQFILRRTVYGQQVYAIGSNYNAAYLAGVRAATVKGIAYILSGILSSLAGFWLIAYNNFVFVNMGAAYVLPSVAAVVIGGTSLAGGEGSYTGTVLGSVILTALASLLVVLHTDEAGRQIINGLVLILLLALYTRQPAIRQ